MDRLRERMTHYTCDSYSQYLPKVERYADVQARVWHAEGRRAKWSSLFFRLPLRFLQGYVWRLGFLDGLAGLQVCFLVAYLSWLKQAYLWQLQSGRDWREADRREYPYHALTAQTNTSAPGSAGGSCEDAALIPSSTPGGAGGYGAEHDIQTAIDEAPRPRHGGTLRELRHRITPSWLSSDARRHRRNMLFRRLGIQRCYTPPIVTRDPELHVRSSLPYVVAHELLRNPRLTFLQIGAYDGIGEDDLRGLVLAHNLRGVLVEPQPSAFARLQHTYRQPTERYVAAGGDRRSRKAHATCSANAAKRRWRLRSSASTCVDMAFKMQTS